MTRDLIRYDLLAQEALRGMVRRVLADTARAGLPGDHHFYITFATDAPGVRMSQTLREQHPSEVTIVVQHQYWDMKVSDSDFEISLSFNGVPEHLRVPFSAIRGFFDPSVSFGLQFDPPDAETDEQDDDTVMRPEPMTVGEAEPAPSEQPVNEDEPGEATDSDQETSDDQPAEGAEVVSLDSFRKKN